MRVQALLSAEYDCPTDRASGGLLIDDLCHALTEREYEIVRLMAQRLNNREIAEKLYLSEAVSGSM